MNKMAHFFFIFSVLVVIVLCAAAEETVPQENALQGDETIPAVMVEDQTGLSELPTFLEQQEPVEQPECEDNSSFDAPPADEAPPMAPAPVPIEEAGPLVVESAAQQPGETPAQQPYENPAQPELQVNSMDTGETSEPAVQNTAEETEASSDGKSIDETDDTRGIRQSDSDDNPSEATCSADPPANEALILHAFDSAGPAVETFEPAGQDIEEETNASCDPKSANESDETCSNRLSETDDFLSDASCSTDHAADEPLIPPAVDGAGADTAEPGLPEMSAPETEEIPQIVQGEIEINSNEVPAGQDTASPPEPEIQKERVHFLSGLLHAVSVSGVTVQQDGWYTEEHAPAEIDLVFHADESRTFAPDWMEYRLPDGLCPEKNPDGTFRGGYAVSNEGRFTFTVDPHRTIAIKNAEGIEDAESLTIHLSVTLNPSETKVLSFGNGIQKSIHLEMQCDDPPDLSREEANPEPVDPDEQPTQAGEADSVDPADLPDSRIPENTHAEQEILSGDSIRSEPLTESEKNEETNLISGQSELFEEDQITALPDGTVPDPLTEKGIETDHLNGNIDEVVTEDNKTDGEGLNTVIFPENVTVQDTPVPDQVLPDSSSLSYTELFVQTNSALIRISGMLPDGAKAEVYSAHAEIPGERLIAAYDIHILYENGNEYYPEDNVLQVCIAEADLQTHSVSSGEEIHVFHLDSAKTSPEQIPCTYDGDHLFFEMKAR